MTRASEEPTVRPYWPGPGRPAGRRAGHVQAGRGARPDVVTRGESAALALRWEATGPGGRLFPALDADIWLTPAGEHSTRLSLAGVYRPPLAAVGAGLDKAVFHRVADATIRSLLARVADVLARSQEPAGAVQGTGMTGTAGRRAAAELS